ncbi:MAG TPA: leukotriene A4 hydrolase C-terminal domain-containing protein, partial [Myxococcaceae bacterium]|nr:leukotriene A4 hydrolase C-terminal domain-containing protein [Myxococcaceae bacterium]
VDGEGIPASAPRPASARLERIRALGSNVPSAAEAAPWRPLDWQVYLGQLPRPTQRETVEALDRAFGLCAAKNPDVLVAFLVPALSAGYRPAVERAQTFLAEVGRMKYLKPLYAALAARPETRGVAEACFERLRGRYHVIAAAGVESLLRRANG